MNIMQKFIAIGEAPITQLRMCVKKIVHIQGKSGDFPYHNYLLLKERIRLLLEQIISSKRSSHFKKGRILRKSLLVPVGSL